jgi:hypothetical protein
MSWKFWQKNSGGSNAGNTQGKKLPGVKEIPQEVGRHLIVVCGYDPDWVWSLRSVARPRVNAKKEFDIRIFNPEHTARAGVSVRDYTTFDTHLELIVLSGWYNKETRDVQIADMKKTG